MEFKHETDTGLDVKPIDLDAGRRAFLRSVGLGAVTATTLVGGVALSGEAQAQAGPTDAEILNFALNLEYLEAEFYLRAAFGEGLDDNLTSGRGNRGQVRGGRQVNFATPAVSDYAEEIAVDEKDHVRFLRNALGAAKVARPAIDIGAAFTAAAAAAGLGNDFDAYANENNFLLAAFIFEDVGVTAYKGAARLIDNKDILEAAAGILAVEAYHAGLIRTTLFAKGLVRPTVNISNLRDSVDGRTSLDQPIMYGETPPHMYPVRTLRGQANIVPADANGIAFSRTPNQVLRIVYLGGENEGGFFPEGVNGAIS